MLLRASWLLPLTATPVREGALLVKDGNIAALGSARALEREHPAEPVTDLGDVVLMPGFVNAHSHVEISLLEGRLAGLSLFPWIRRIVELRQTCLEAEDDRVSSLLGAIDAIRAGVTCLGDCSASGAPMAALAEAGLRGVVFHEAFALSSSDVPAALASWDEKEERHTELLSAFPDAMGRVGFGLSPHTPYTACPELLRAAAARARTQGLPLSIHVAESQAELAFLQDGTGPIAENRRSRGLPTGGHAEGPVALLEESGWLDLPGPVQLVHLTQASPAEFARLGQAITQGRDLTAVACPRSNASLGNGSAPLLAMQEHRLPWCLGTDGAPAVGSCDMFSEMRAASALLPDSTRGASSKDLLLRSTLHAARSLGLAERVGSLDVGKAADLIALGWDDAPASLGSDPHGAVVHDASPDNIRWVMVAGEVLLSRDAGEQRRTCRRLDESAVRESASQRSERLDAFIGRDDNPEPEAGR